MVHMVSRNLCSKIFKAFLLLFGLITAEAIERRWEKREKSVFKYFTKLSEKRMYRILYFNKVEKRGSGSSAFLWILYGLQNIGERWFCHCILHSKTRMNEQAELGLSDMWISLTSYSMYLVKQHPIIMQTS